MQFKVSNKAVRQNALAALQKVHGSPHVDINRVADKPVQKQRQVSRELEDCRHAQFEVEEEGLSGIVYRQGSAS